MCMYCHERAFWPPAEQTCMSLSICHRWALAKHWICSRAWRQPRTDEDMKDAVGEKSSIITDVQITSTPAFCQETPGECRELRKATFSSIELFSDFMASFYFMPYVDWFHFFPSTVSWARLLALAWLSSRKGLSMLKTKYLSDCWIALETFFLMAGVGQLYPTTVGTFFNRQSDNQVAFIWM